MTDQNNEPINPVKLALVIDGEVLDILHTDERLAAILLSSPKCIDVSDYPEDMELMVGFFYNEQSGSFSFTQL